jgi:4-hydroxy-3-methylbut-2-enyl diphosphate reductase
VILVVGSPNSSNSNRLREIAAEMGIASYLIDTAEDIDPAWFVDVDAVGVTAGASAPEELVQEVLTRLGQIAPVAIENLEGVEENVRFKLPEMLWDVAGSPYGRMGRPQPREGERNTAAASAE